MVQTRKMQALKQQESQENSAQKQTEKKIEKPNMEVIKKLYNGSRESSNEKKIIEDKNKNANFRRKQKATGRWN